MKESQPGIYVRGRYPLVEMRARRTDSYSKFAERMMKVLKLSAKEEKYPVIFKLNGARVLDSKWNYKAMDTWKLSTDAKEICQQHKDGYWICISRQLRSSSKYIMEKFTVQIFSIHTI